jgi:hypothetical protein
MIDRLFDGTWIVTRVGLEAVQANGLAKSMRSPIIKKAATDKRFFVRALNIVKNSHPHLNLPPSKGGRKK